MVTNRMFLKTMRFCPKHHIKLTVFFSHLLCCNYNDQDVVKRLFASLRQNRDTISLMSHEQYTYEDYFNYIPDHLDRVELACRLATEHGYKPVWFPEGILGNNAWEK